VRQHDEAAREAILARLAASRAEILRVLEPPAEEAGGLAQARGFPRSRTMQLIMSGRGIGGLIAIAGGVLIARPALAWRLLRLAPTSTLARIALARILRALRGDSATLRTNPEVSRLEPDIATQPEPPSTRPSASR